MLLKITVLIEDPVQTDEYLIVTYIPIRELLIMRPAKNNLFNTSSGNLVDVDKTIEQNIIKGIKLRRILAKKEHFI